MERVTGIEPALSAWEQVRGAFGRGEGQEFPGSRRQLGARRGTGSGPFGGRQIPNSNGFIVASKDGTERHRAGSKNNVGGMTCRTGGAAAGHAREGGSPSGIRAASIGTARLDCQRGRSRSVTSGHLIRSAPTAHVAHRGCGGHRASMPRILASLGRAVLAVGCANWTGCARARDISVTSVDMPCQAKRTENEGRICPGSARCAEPVVAPLGAEPIS